MTQTIKYVPEIIRKTEYIIIVLNINFLIRILLKVSNNSQPIKYMYI